MKLIVTAHFADGREKVAVVEPEVAVGAARDLCFRLAASSQVVSFTITKDDLVTRVLDGRLKVGA